MGTQNVWVPSTLLESIQMQLACSDEIAFSKPVAAYLEKSM